MESLLGQVVPNRVALKLTEAECLRQRESMQRQMLAGQQQEQQQAAAVAQRLQQQRSAAPTAAAGGASGSGPAQLRAGSGSSGSDDVRSMVGGMGRLLDFQLPAMEAAFRSAVPPRRRVSADVAAGVALLLLAGLHELQRMPTTRSPVADITTSVVVLLMLVGMVRQVARRWPRAYGAWREPLLAVLRCAGLLALLRWPQPLHDVAPPCLSHLALGLSHLLVHGLLCRMRLRLHLPLQVVAALVVAWVTLRCPHIRMPRTAVVLMLELLLGLALPLVTTYMRERRARLDFLRKLQ